MLKFSTRGQYALLVMTDLAEHNSEKYVPLKLLSHRRNLSVKYLEQILIQLAKANLVIGLRGHRRYKEMGAAGDLRAEARGEHRPSHLP